MTWKPDASKIVLLEGAGSAWARAANEPENLGESTITVSDDAGRDYTVSDADLSRAMISMGIPHQERGKYKGSSRLPISAGILSQIKKAPSFTKVAPPVKQGGPKTKFDWERTSKSEISAAAAKKKLLKALDKWADDAASDWEPQEDGPTADQVAADMADGAFHDGEIKALLAKSGMKASIAKEIAADLFYQYALRNESVRDRGIGGVVFGAHAIGSLSSFAKAEGAPWLPPFIWGSRDNEPTEDKRSDTASMKKDGVKWRDTPTGHTIGISAGGKITKGNPKVIGGEGGKAASAKSKSAKSSSAAAPTDDEQDVPSQGPGKKPGAAERFARAFRGQHNQVRHD